jgi:sugar/nucleoside kinase (ribokinase family)
MYINQLDNVSFVNNIEEGIISADITSGKIKNLELLSIIDFLFISDEDLFMDIDELAKLVKGWIILHYPEGSYSSNGKESVLVKNEILENVNVLGAGDIFAASFMYKHLNDQDIKICIEYAHSNTTYILQQRKLENETTKKKKSK